MAAALSEEVLWHTLTRWLTPDPLSEKYYGISPYAFCNEDPVNKFDPDGRDEWELQNNGIIKRIKESDTHRIYTVSDNGNRQYVQISNRSFLNQLAGKHKQNGTVTYSLVSNNDSNFADAKRLFAILSFLCAKKLDIDWKKRIFAVVSW